jgi:hypothetical protein
MWSNALRRNRTLASATVLLGGALFCHVQITSADDFWKHKPPAEWSRSEALKILRNSPWAKVEIIVFLPQGDQSDYSVATGASHCDPDAIDQSGNCTQKNRIEVPVDESRRSDAAPQISPSTTFLVVWQSPIVRQAFARLHELGERTIAAFQAEPPRVPADRYVITVKLEQPGLLRFSPLAASPAAEPTLRASLKTEQGAVGPLETEFTGVGANSAVHFFFPRILNGKALLGPNVKLAEFNVQGRGFAMRARFKIDSVFLEDMAVR